MIRRMASLRPLVRTLPLAGIALLLGGCGLVVLDPAGDVARQQGNLVMISTALMLVVILPVMALTIFFAWRYRASRKARYEPEWDHSTSLELVIWSVPLLIIICLGALTWVATHLLDPYRPLARTAPGKQVAATASPLEVNVVALDWKWLFIYPQYGVATVNELAVPADRPIRFRISASSVMNSFYVPALAGQIYAMPGMETKLHAVLNKPGNYEGFSANYSGAGFSGMRFAVKGLTANGFDAWLEKARGGGDRLDRAAYLKLEQPSENVPARRFAAVDEGLFDAIVNLCVEPGKMCMHDMMSIDAKGGMGLAGIHNVRPLAYDKHAGRGSGAAPDAKMVAALCAMPAPPVGEKLAKRVDPSPLVGAGLPNPADFKSVLIAGGRDAPGPAPVSRPNS